MKRFFRHRGGRGFRGRRRRRRVTWLTDTNLRQNDGEITAGELYSSPLAFINNDFVENHPRFAKRNDLIPYRRILGDLRVALYNTTPGVAKEGLDYIFDYGICLIKGDYDSAGVWTPTDQLPDPREPSDEDEKWLFKNRVILSFGGLRTDFYERSSLSLAQLIDSNTFELAVSVSPATTDGMTVFQQETRPRMMSTDEQLPSGSKVDISTKRKAQYAEKLYILAYCETGNTDTDSTLLSIAWRLRVLAAG